MTELLSYPPIYKALITLIISATGFPLCGVIVVRMNLIPLRYALMHGVILGGAIALAFSIPQLPVMIITNILVVIMIIKLGRGAVNNSLSSAAAMVLSMGFASIIMHYFDVPSKDTLSLLWGSPFALSWGDITVVFLTTLILILYITVMFRTISAMFFDKEIASSMGINTELHTTLMTFIIAITVALAMKLLGALLVDALLILPVMSVLPYCSSLKTLFISSSLAGLGISLVGFFLSLATDLPLSGTIAICAGLLYIILKIGKRKNSDKR